MNISYNSNDIIDPVCIINKYAIFSTIKDDIIFRNSERPIFCGGIVKDIGRNVYNLKKNDLIGYITYEQDLNISLSSNLVNIIPYNDPLKLLAILPYAAYGVELLRTINPTIGQKIAIIGSNFFIILLAKLLRLSGAAISIINISENIMEYKNKKEIEMINGFDLSTDNFNTKLDFLIIIPSPNQFINDFLKKIKFNVKIHINEMVSFGKGFKDPDYIKGLKYPFSYIRWDFKRNLKYFINLVNKRIITLEFLEILRIKIESATEITQKIQEINKNLLMLFEILYYNTIKSNLFLICILKNSLDMEDL